ncbi:MAG: hypothetical protein EPO28_03440 [Saprospiraceae bacterium]|nr:MAG: hypothetical protein EPO28_03440 [Saprospiraceae bacterium]
MKKIITLVFPLFFGLQVFAQSAYQDAFELAGLYRRNGNSFKPLTRTDAADTTLLDLGRFLDILYRHYDTIWGPTPAPTANNIISSYNENPFFEKYQLPVGVNDVASETALKMAAESAITNKSALGALGTASPGISVAVLADGVAKFLVKRTKEELTVAFFEEFREVLASNDELEILFPGTRMILLGIGDQIYNFNAYIDSMREAFISDLKRLHNNLDELLTNNKVEVLKEDTPVNYISALFKATEMLAGKASLKEIITYLGRDAAFQNFNSTTEPQAITKVKSAMRLLYLISESVEGDGFDDRLWVAPVQFRKMLKDRLVLDFYLGLVYEKTKNTSFGSLKVADTFSTQNADEFLTTLNAFIELGEDLHGVTQRIHTGEYQQNDSLLYYEYFDYTQVALDLIKTTGKFVAVVSQKDSVLQQKLEEVTFVLGRISSITLDVRRKHYSNAIVHAGLLVNELILPEKDFSCPLLRYGAFMAAISESRNSNDVAAVMEAFALPRGSSYIKKHYPFNLSIGSYVGFNAGVETLSKLDSKDKTGLNAGMGAPIGVAFSWGGKSDAGHSPGSYTYYLSVVDIGAFTAFRFTNNDAVNDLPSLNFSNLFAPGAAFIYGLPKFPGSVGLFMQRGPSLRKVTSAGYEFDETNGWRFGIMASVDIPLFNMFTKGKKSGCSYSPE